ncbi:hypothetical protein AAHB37_11110 [Glutamicibacter halophytocola]|uniref:hypothetical protein n=1 Tax=Glutamicibacter halophytocola TaxID=1933880 RepID=UPI00321C1B29
MRFSVGAIPAICPNCARAKPACPIPGHGRRRTRRQPARLDAAKAVLGEVGEHWNIPAENLLTPKYLRELCWNPPALISVETVAEKLDSMGARPWQQELLSAGLAQAFASS